MTGRSTPVIGVALDHAGAAATARQLVDLALVAERGNLDFVSLDDSLDPRAPGSDGVHLDALLSLAHVAAATTTIGVVPTVTVTHTEPFHVSKNIATLDLVSGGRGGWQVAVSTTPEGAARFGRRAPHATAVTPLGELFAEADDVVEVVRRLWDSWEDDAVIRDRPTGRYIDRDKLHYIDFRGPFFEVRGPSITPRPPQGQPIVAVRAIDDESTAFAARNADLVFVEGDVDEVRGHRAAIHEAARRTGRPADDVTVLATISTDADVDPQQIAGVLVEWFTSGATDGFLLRPEVLPDGLDALVDDVLPLLADRGLLVADLAGTTFRERLGLARPANRYAAATGAST